MRILILHSDPIFSFPSGELEVAKFEKYCLEKYGHSVKFMTFGKEKQPVNYLLRSLHAIFTGLWSYSAKIFIHKIYKEFRPDVIHFHGIYPYLTASALSAAHKTNAVVIQTLHNGRWVCLEGGFYRSGTFCEDCLTESSFMGLKYGCKNGRLVSAFTYLSNFNALKAGKLFKWVDGFVAVSKFIKDQHVRAGFPENKIFVKKNGIELAPSYYKNQRNEKQCSGIVFVGRISNAKGVSILKKVIASIDEPIMILGVGPEFQRLRDYCTTNNFDHVIFKGKQTRKQCIQIMNNAKCAIVPSQCGEAFSLVAAEAMSLGVPIIASDIGGLGELIRDSGAGIIVESKNSDGFISAIKNVLETPKLSESLGIAGKKFANTNLNAEKNVQELMDIYNFVLKRKNNANSI